MVLPLSELPRRHLHLRGPRSYWDSPLACLEPAFLQLECASAAVGDLLWVGSRPVTSRSPCRLRLTLPGVASQLMSDEAWVFVDTQEPAAEPDPGPLPAARSAVLPVPLAALLPLVSRIGTLEGVSATSRIVRAHRTGQQLHITVAAGEPGDGPVRSGVAKHRCWAVIGPATLRVFDRARTANTYFWSLPCPAYCVGLASLAEAYALICGAARQPVTSMGLG